MKRRNFAKIFTLASLGAAGTVNISSKPSPSNKKIEDHRKFWIETLIKISDPLLVSLSKNKLKEEMPFEIPPNGRTRNKERTYLEGLGRLAAGIAPWLELGSCNDSEGILREKYIKLMQNCLYNATDPNSPDYMPFDAGDQQLVDAAFLAHGLIRAPKELWINLDAKTQNNLIKAFESTRKITPYFNNWLLFSGIIEAFFAKFELPFDRMRIDYAVNQHMQWYKGDGIYGDGPEFHWDYYNSFVIQPMIIDIVEIINNMQGQKHHAYDKVISAAKRYAEIQERMISPEGTFPPIGRSLPYRFGAFQLLSQMSLRNELPNNISPAGVRSALTRVIERMINCPGTFDDNNWLKIGFMGSQPDIAEEYISTGSLYLCSTAFLPLGLTQDSDFWNKTAENWTSKKIWGGENGIKNDKALRNI